MFVLSLPHCVILTTRGRPLQNDKESLKRYLETMICHSSDTVWEIFDFMMGSAVCAFVIFKHVGVLEKYTPVWWSVRCNVFIANTHGVKQSFLIGSRERTRKRRSVVGDLETGDAPSCHSLVI